MRALKLTIRIIGSMMILVGLFFVPSALVILCGCGFVGLPSVVGSTHGGDLEERYGWDEEESKPTKLDKLVETYMKGDPLDPSTTLDFLIAADELEDPFAEAPVPKRLPPPKPSDAATSARPPKHRTTCKKHADVYSVMDDLARSYAMTYGVPSHSLQCQICGQIGSFSSGACHACGSRAMHPSWAIWHEGGVVDYYDKRKMEVDAYQMQKQRKKITIFDSNGKQLFVAPAPKLIQEHKKEMKQLRDAKGRFTKSKGCECGLCSGVGTINPLDEPYPVEYIGDWPNRLPV